MPKPRADLMKLTAIQKFQQYRIKLATVVSAQSTSGGAEGRLDGACGAYVRTQRTGNCGPDGDADGLSSGALRCRVER